MMIIPGISNILLAVATSSCTSNLSSCFTTTYDAWFALAALIAVTTISVLAVIYGVCQFIGRSDIKSWVRVKIFDVCLSLLLIIAFLVVANLLYNFSLSGLAGSPIDLVPSQCTSATGNLYNLATCDIYQFNVFTSYLSVYQYWGTLLYALIPEVNFNIAGPSSSIPISLGGSIEILPVGTTMKYLGAAVDAVYVFYLLNSVQLILISASAVIFAILMSLGLTARLFGITRTFGGAMMAFAIGIGIIYPMLICLNYGFLDYGLSTITPQVQEALIAQFGSQLAAPVTGLVSLLSGFFYTWATGNPNFTTIFPQSLFIYLGLVWVGLAFVPILTFIIVDVFIIDFSQAIGERMDLLSLLVRLV